ncbi:MAG TPA: flap endonuclease, partial [Actinotalea sp.]|nr:flap endonuclease [Actinotalea sp.]
GIGEKSAAAMVTRFGSLAGVLGALEAGDPQLTASQAARLREAHEYLAVAPRVVRVVKDLPIAPFDDELPRTPADPGAVVALAERWGLTSSAARLVDALSG